MKTLSPGDLGYFVGLGSAIGTSQKTVAPEAVTDGYISRTLCVSPAFGMHGYTQRQLAWQTDWTTAASAITIELQGSIDGKTWNDLDSSTSTGGETRYISTDDLKNFSFFRVTITAQTGAAAGTVVLKLL
jgi:hypothetical protein